MASYKLFIKPSAVKELEGIPEKDRPFDPAIGGTQDRQIIVYRFQGLTEPPAQEVVKSSRTRANTA